jgi:hypothetical protein
MTKAELLKQIEKMPDDTRMLIVIGEKSDKDSVNFGGHYNYVELAEIDVTEALQSKYFEPTVALRGFGTTKFAVRKTNRE